MGDPWAWCLRLFVSIDLIGSTAYKAAGAKDEIPEWAMAFREFFGELPARLGRAYDGAREQLKPSRPLVTWKFMGDEVLFHTVVESYLDPARHALLVRDVLRAFADEWHAKSMPMTPKATAWLAGFPVTNTAFQLPQTDPDARPALDFIGPSIDLGFRLTRFATDRKFVLSADLAYMVIDGLADLHVSQDSAKLYLDESVPLKGVLEGKPYPVAWIDVRPEVEEKRDRLLGVRRRSEHQTLREVLKADIDRMGPLVFPFIEGDKDHKYDKVPAALSRKRDAMREKAGHTLSEFRYTGDAPPTDPGAAPAELPDPSPAAAAPPPDDGFDVEHY